MMCIETGFQDRFEPGKASPLVGSSTEKVHGLASFLASIQLQHHLADAEAWCDEMGAAFLAEVLENVEDLWESLPLSTDEFDRLPKELPLTPSTDIGSDVSSPADTDEDNRPIPQALHDATGEDNMAEALNDCNELHETERSASEPMRNTLGLHAELIGKPRSAGLGIERRPSTLLSPNNAPLGSPLSRTTSVPVPSPKHMATSPKNPFFQKEDEIRRQHCFDCPAAAAEQPSKIEGELMQGLAEFLSTLKLEAHLHAAQSWCEEMGAAFLSEVLENIDDLWDTLPLSEDERGRLRAAHEEVSAACGASEVTQPRSSACQDTSCQRGDEETDRIRNFIVKHRKISGKSVGFHDLLPDETRCKSITLGHLPSVPEDADLVFNGSAPAT